VPLRALAKRTARLKLANLNFEACGELVRSIFGNKPNIGRLDTLDLAL
jgi:hypothetical protein